jgi:3-dehydroquinate dehydratase/shikimate dehydrogenase
MQRLSLIKIADRTMKNLTQALPPPVLRARLGRICVALAGDTIGEMLETAEMQVKENPFLEFRLDYLDNPLAALPKLKKFLSENSVVTAVGTCRRVSNGGRFKGTPAAQIEVLRKAIDAGCQLVDVELETAVAVKKPEIDELREMAAVILSYHDYETTENLDAIYERMKKFDPDFYKIVSTARTLYDNVTMIRFLERVRHESSVIGICMGDAGIISRVLGVRAGSEFTFAAASVGEETGPGQIAARTLRETYRIDQVEPGTKVYGVAGSPVKHSLSPLMMNVAFRRETVNAVYLQLQSTRIKDLLQLVQEIPLQGFSVTMPLKQEVMKHLQRSDALSAKVGACNMVVRSQEGKLFGFNTDVTGIIQPLEQRFSLKGAKVLVLGAGGAARAAVFALRDREADVYVLNRTAESGQKLAREAKVKTFRKDQLAKAQWDVIINATPVGMVGYKQQSWLEPNEVNARIVFDMVYDPMETPLVRTARQKGAQVITGAEMFVYQGAEQFQIWTGKPAPREEMMRVVLHALQQRAGAQPASAATARPAPEAAKPAGKSSEKPVKAVTAKAPQARAGSMKPAPAKAVAQRAVAQRAPVKKAPEKKAVARKTPAKPDGKPRR